MNTRILLVLVVLLASCASFDAARARVEDRLDEIGETLVENATEIEAAQTLARTWIPSPWGEILAGAVALGLAALEARRQARKVDAERDARRLARDEPVAVPAGDTRRAEER
jgi:hypothetical protein